MNKSLRPDDRIVLYGDIRVAPGVAFYCHRRVLLYKASSSNLEFGSRYADAPRTLLGDREFLALWSGPERVLLVVPADKDEEAVEALPRDAACLLVAAGGKTVYVNRPVVDCRRPNPPGRPGTRLKGEPHLAEDRPLEIVPEVVLPDAVVERVRGLEAGGHPAVHPADAERRVDEVVRVGVPVVPHVQDVGEEGLVHVAVGGAADVA
jgi:hypothetical protein